jgi:hypothetical protein
MKKRINNQPPRPQISFTKTNHNFTAATPPSKGGETYLSYIQYLTFCFKLESLALLIYLTPYVDGYALNPSSIGEGIEEWTTRGIGHINN